jgi:hypothetical protein
MIYVNCILENDKYLMRTEGIKFKVPTNLLEDDSLIFLPRQINASSYLHLNI